MEVKADKNMEESMDRKHELMGDGMQALGRRPKIE
jgi:hypothetical protein